MSKQTFSPENPYRDPASPERAALEAGYYNEHGDFDPRRLAGDPPITFRQALMLARQRWEKAHRRQQRLAEIAAHPIGRVRLCDCCGEPFGRLVMDRHPLTGRPLVPRSHELDVDQGALVSGSGGYQLRAGRVCRAHCLKMLADINRRGPVSWQKTTLQCLREMAINDYREWERWKRWWGLDDARLTRLLRYLREHGDYAGARHDYTQTATPRTRRTVDIDESDLKVKP